MDARLATLRSQGLTEPSAKRWVHGYRRSRSARARAALRVVDSYAQPLPYYRSEKRSLVNGSVAFCAPRGMTGKAFNIFGLALITRMLALQCDLEPGEIVWQGGDVHLYLNHAELVEEQLSRKPSGAPRLRILRRPDTIFDHRIEDFAVEDYEPQRGISAPVAV